MNGVNDFLNDFKSSNAKITGVKKLLSKQMVALLGVVALSGCQMTGNEYVEELPQTNQIESSVENQSSMGFFAKKITKDNYEDIIRNGKSGVYQHPFYPERIKTFLFENDKEAESNIQRDLNKLGINDAGYMWQQFLLNQTNFIEGKGGNSRHLQDFFGVGTDVNLSRIRSHDYIGKNPLYVYYVLMHEAGHSLDHQQLDAIDFIKAPFDYEKLIMLENSSDVASLVKTYKLAKEMGELDSFDNLLNSLEIKAEKSNRDIKSEMNRNTKKDVHQVLPTLAIFKNIRNKSPEVLDGISEGEIPLFAEKISKIVIEHDYLPDYIKSFRGEKLRDIESLILAASKTAIEEPEKYKEAMATIDKTYEETKLTGRYKVAKEIKGVADAIKGREQEIQDNKDNPSYMKQLIIDVSKEKDLLGRKEILIDDFDVNIVFSEMQTMDSLIAVVMEDDFVKSKINQNKAKNIIDVNEEQRSKLLDEISEDSTVDSVNKTSYDKTEKSKQKRKI